MIWTDFPRGSGYKFPGSRSQKGVVTSCRPLKSAQNAFDDKFLGGMSHVWKFLKDRPLLHLLCFALFYEQFLVGMKGEFSVVELCHQEVFGAEPGGLD